MSRLRGLRFDTGMSVRQAVATTMAIATVLLGAQALPADAYPRPGLTGRVSIAGDGTEANQPAANNYPAMSADGRFVAFASFASNLVPSGTNDDYEDVFVHDRVTGVTEQVSVAADGSQGDAASWWPSMSTDGRFVAFASAASNLVPGDTNDSWDVFVHDRATGTTERVSIASDGTESNHHSRGPAISADGRVVAFYSTASNLVPDDTNSGDDDVFVHDRATGTTERVSVRSDGSQVASSGNNTWTPAISADGRYVAFTHSANDLVPGDNGVYWDVFVHDRAEATTERVSVASDGAQANGNSNSPSISADGRFVAFDSFASNLVPGDTNGTGDVFVHDRATGATDRVSLASDGSEGDRASWPPAISADGRVVAFNSLAANLVPDDRNGGRDVFVRERGLPLGVVGELSTVSVAAGLRVAGLATSSGVVTSEAVDPTDDGAVGPLDADELGAELTGASLTYRPEQEDHLLRWRLRSLPRGPLVTGAVGGGHPGVLYGVEFQADGTRFEIRALRAAITSDPPRIPHAALYRCAPQCVQEALLTGGFGTVGAEVRVSLPVDVLDAEVAEAELTDIRAFTALGEAAQGGLEELDEVTLPPAGIPEATVGLGIASAATPEHEVAFAHPAALSQGEFVGDVPTGTLPAGTYRVWARSCLGEACGPAVFVEVVL